jgi:hypothetical protein
LRGESKLAAMFLRHLAGYRPQTLQVAPAELAAELGASDRAARRWLTNLAEVGLIEILDRPGRGTWTLYVQDPAEAAGPKAVHADPQARLFDVDDRPGGSAPEPAASPSAAAVSVSKPPAVSVPKPPQDSLRKSFELQAQYQPSDDSPRGVSGGFGVKTAASHVTLRNQEHLTLNRDRVLEAPKKNLTTCARPGHASADVAEALAGVLGTPPDAQQRAGALRGLVSYLTEAVGDPTMNASIAERAAAAVVDGHVELDALQRAAEATRRKRLAGELRKPPRAYFRSRCIAEGIEAMRYATPKPEPKPQQPR